MSDKWKTRPGPKERKTIHICPCGWEGTPFELDRKVVETDAGEAFGQTCPECNRIRPQLRSIDR